MKRRTFFKQTAFSVLSTSVLSSLSTYANINVSEDSYPLQFLAIGDWGRNGADHQLHVARQMGKWATEHPNQFIISTGDNFYPSGVISEHDPLFHYSFENVYTDFSLQWDWYPILGNHDYKSDPDAQVRYTNISRRWKIVVGHHPMYTAGPRTTNYDTLGIRKILEEVLEKHKVNVYLSGHDHSLQHLKSNGVTHHLISGAGSEVTPVKDGLPYSRFQAADYGFMYFSVARDQLNVKVINHEGKLLYETLIFPIS